MKYQHSKRSSTLKFIHTVGKYAKSETWNNGTNNTNELDKNRNCIINCTIFMCLNIPYHGIYFFVVFSIGNFCLMKYSVRGFFLSLPLALTSLGWNEWEEEQKLLGKLSMANNILMHGTHYCCIILHFVYSARIIMHTEYLIISLLIHLQLKLNEWMKDLLHFLW